MSQESEPGFIQIKELHKHKEVHEKVKPSEAIEEIHIKAMMRSSLHTCKNRY